MGDPDVKLLLLIVLAAGLAGAFWVFRDDILPVAPESVVVLPEDTAPEAPTQTLPSHPLTPPRPSDAEDRNLVSLPALDDSDGYFLLALIDVFGPDVERLLVDEALIDKFVATVDNLPRSHVPEILPASCVEELHRCSSHAFRAYRIGP